MIHALAPRADSLARSAVSLRQARGPVGALFQGDSITFADSDNNSNLTGMGSWAAQLCWRSGGRIVMRRNAAIPGEPSTGIAARLADEGLNLPGVDVVFLLQGTNDIAQAIALETTLASDRRAIRAIQARGLRALLVACPPSDAAPAATGALNAAKRALAAAEGASWIDPWSGVRQPDGRFAAGFSGDGVHPSQAAAALAAQAALADPALAPLLPSFGQRGYLGPVELESPLPVSSFASTHATANGPVPNGYMSYGIAPTGSWTTAVAEDAVSAERLFTISAAAGATGGWVIDTGAGGAFDVTALAGRRVAFSGRLRTQGLAQSGGTVLVRLQGSAGADPAEGGGLLIQPVSGLSTDGDGYFHGEGQVPAGASRAELAVIVTGVAGGSGMSVAFGEMTLRPTPWQGLDIRTRRRPRRIRHLSASAALTLDDATVLVDASAGPVTLTLPPAGTSHYGFGSYAGFYQQRMAGTGLDYTIVKADGSAHAVTVQTAGGDSIEGAAMLTLAGPWAKAQLLAARRDLFIRTG